MLWRSVELFGVERDEGVVGWGEATDHGHPVSLA
jgi:L-alanine-DL-glutamate epimerase-like enolase superfamily enzyme